ncbi:MAG: precorrin-8X methylmutase [Thermoleophilia bacterium]|nr:precorrin-8X methylmutase [Thermoleophilia bacterium]
MTAKFGNALKTGVVVLGHGSRAPEAALLLEWVAGRLAARCEYPVTAASLQFNRPTLAESCRHLAAGGVRRIVVTPYFLFAGNHMKLDIPEELRKLETELPGVELVLAGSLGADSRLVDVMLARIEESVAGRCGSGPPPGSSERASLPQHPIESESFEVIDQMLKPSDPASPEYQITRRVVHATGDPGLAGELVFSRDAVGSALRILENGAAAAGCTGADDDVGTGNDAGRGLDAGGWRGARASGSSGRGDARIICDVKMVAAGIEPTAARMGLDVCCRITGEETLNLARREGITRGAAGIRRAAGALGDAIIVIGNAPTALFECLRLAEETGARPALIVGVPVGFIGAAESKRALMDSGLPHITLPGHRGGSNVAVAAANALMRLAAAGAPRDARGPNATGIHAGGNCGRMRRS